MVDQNQIDELYNDKKHVVQKSETMFHIKENGYYLPTGNDR
jgi:hypothetical protein